jgi:predicted glycoside hydrolase/deacetylase ChbG (UPF0249 family)
MTNSSRPLLIIVNADDFGASVRINEAICRELDAGRVKSATLMANGPAFPDAVRRLRAHPAASFGVHLNLTEFPPLTSSPELRRLLDADGSLHPGLRYRLFGPKELGAVYQEFAAQILRALQSGVRISHLDSHWHIHTRPDFLPIIQLLQHEYGIRRVRSRLNVYPLQQPPSLLNRLAIPMCNAALRMYPGNRTTDRMAPLAVFVQHLRSGHRPDFASIELMVHPGYESPDYVAEVKLLASDWTAVLRRPFKFVSFWDI